MNNEEKHFLVSDIPYVKHKIVNLDMMAELLAITARMEYMKAHKDKVDCDKRIADAYKEDHDNIHFKF